MNIFDLHGIKEVADVTIYSIHQKKDGSGDVYYVPALYLNTLKISSTEKVADDVWATGGLGNSRLICWDYGKEIDVKLEDALCSPASLDLCWGGVLGADWENENIVMDFDKKVYNSQLTRFEKYFYSKNDKPFISQLLPQVKKQNLSNKEIPTNIPELDDIDVRGNGYFRGHIFEWTLNINSAARTIYTYPNNVFLTNGTTRKVDKTKPLNVNFYVDSKLYKYSVDYTLKNKEVIRVCVDNDDNYTIKTKEEDGNWIENDLYDAYFFKLIDMWYSFNGLNDLIYFLITKYEQDIKAIKDNKLWAYVNPNTLTPYPDDYWLSQGEGYYIKSFDFIKNEEHCKRITVKANQWAGMYKVVGQTYIKDRETGIDVPFQLIFPFCKVKSNQTLSLTADGEPTTFNLDLQIANNSTNILMELIEYKEIPLENE